MNREIFLWINSFAARNSILDFFGFAMAQDMVYVFILIEFYIYFVSKKRDEAIFAFESMVLGVVLNQIISLFYFHNRPFMDGLGHTILHHNPDNSFPSDHTTFMMAIAISLFLQKDTKTWGVWLFVLAFIGGFSRVFVGVHYPFDIIGSIFTGALGAFLVFTQQKRLQKINNLIYKIENRIFKRQT
ncbi:MAG: undecaprenyl-diphosphatase [Epsilonproteobacteria bacterium]|nr:undecaprenyl-diphosphatase [Campylobacterota bacterium]